MYTGFTTPNEAKIHVHVYVHVNTCKYMYTYIYNLYMQWCGDSQSYRGALSNKSREGSVTLNLNCVIYKVHVHVYSEKEIRRRG